MCKSASFRKDLLALFRIKLLKKRARTVERRRREYLGCEAVAFSDCSRQGKLSFTGVSRLGNDDKSISDLLRSHQPDGPDHCRKKTEIAKDCEVLGWIQYLITPLRLSRPISVAVG